MKKFFVSLIFSLLVVLAVPATSLAHETIFTFKGIDGNNLIMVTHNVHDARAGAPISYNLRLYTMDGQLVPFEAVKADVSEGSRTLTDQTIKVSEFNDATFTYAFPREGNYTLSLQFLDHDKQVAAEDFPIVVEPGVDTNFFSDFLSLQSGIAFALGAIVAALYFNRTKWHLRTGKKRS